MGCPQSIRQRSQSRWTIQIQLAPMCKNHELCTKRLTLILQMVMLCILYVRNEGAIWQFLDTLASAQMANL